MSLLVGLAAAAAGLALAGLGVFWIGFQTVPVGFKSEVPEDSEEKPEELERQPLPSHLPVPVGRSLHKALGEPPKVVQSAAVRGRGRYRLYGLLVPMRFRAWYQPGKSYRRTIEVTWFGRTVLRIKESWRGGRGYRSMAGWGTGDEQGSEIDLEGLRALWSETVWFPSAFAEARWTGPPDPSAEKGRQRKVTSRLDSAALAATFHGRSGRLQSLISDDGPRWQALFDDWRSFHGVEIPIVVRIHRQSSTWPDVVFVVDGVDYNLPVEA